MVVIYKDHLSLTDIVSSHWSILIEPLSFWQSKLKNHDLTALQKIQELVDAGKNEGFDSVK